MPAADAAAILGLSAGHLRRKCEQLVDAGMAMWGELPGGQTGWLIHRGYDRRLMEQNEPISAADLDRYGDRQQRLAWARWDCVCRFRAAKQDRRGAIAKWLPAFLQTLEIEVARPLAEKYGDTLKISRSQLYQWNRRAATIADIDKLVDQRGGDTFSQGSPEFWREFGRLYLDDSSRKVKACWRRARDWARAEGFDACSYQSVLRQLDQRFPPAVQAACRDPKAYRDQVEPTAELHPETFAANERWESDMRTCDVRVILPDGKIGRPIMTGWLDWRTRRCVAHRVEAYGDSETITTSLHDGLADEDNIGGPPRLVWFDNGKDYLSVAGKTRRKIEDADVPRVRGLLADLGMELHLALPKGPRGKARIERWFQTKGIQLDAFLPGYCGNEPKNRPESLAAKEKTGQGLLTLDQYRQEVAAWIARYNESADHDKADLRDERGRKLSPNAAFRAWVSEKRAYPNPQSLKYLLMRWHKPLTVGKKGIRIEIEGQSFYYGATAQALIPYRRAPGRRGRKKKYVFAAYDPRHMGQIYVWEAIERDGVHQRGRFICLAELNHQGGRYGTDANRQQAKQVARDRRRFNKTVKEYRDNAPYAKMRPEERLALAAAKQQPPQAAGALKVAGMDADAMPGARGPIRGPMAIKPVATPIDGQLDAVARAELRQAAGGGDAHAHSPATRRPLNIGDAMSRMQGMGGRKRSGDKPRLRLTEAFEHKGNDDE